jgi:hypothetical protein
MNLAIVGWRGYTDYKAFSARVDEWITKNGAPACIISGGAKGTDKMAEAYALERSIPTKIFEPNWTLGKGAGLLRNTDIVRVADHVLAFVSPKSIGTLDTITKANNMEVPVTIVRI